MKKLGYIFFLIIIVVAVNACKPTPNNESYTNSKLIISKYYSTTELSDTALELYNISNSDIDLTNWQIDIYSNGEMISTYSIVLDGIVKAHDYYVISNASTQNETLISKTNLSSSQLLFNGDDAITLSNNNKVMDVLGNIGGSGDFGRYVTLIRKPAYFKARSKFQPYDFIMYLEGLFKYLKNEDYPVKTDEELNAGPVLLDEYRELPFFSSTSGLGGGGVIEVELVNPTDGDTARFKTKDGSKIFIDSNNTSLLTDQFSLRFALIDTRENSPSGGFQEWGQPASAFMRDILTKAQADGKKIEVQSILNDGLRDSFGRYLGYLWIDGYLVNFMIVRAGLSDARTDDLSLEAKSFQYNEVSYVGYCENAEVRAQMNGWGIYGEKDPMWNYETKTPLLGAPVYIPDARE